MFSINSKKNFRTAIFWWRLDLPFMLYYYAEPLCDSWCYISNWLCNLFINSCLYVDNLSSFQAAWNSSHHKYSKFPFNSDFPKPRREAGKRCLPVSLLAYPSCVVLCYRWVFSVSIFNKLEKTLFSVYYLLGLC